MGDRTHCGKVGDNCRKRVAELGERQSALEVLQRNKATADRAEALDGQIGTLEEKIREVGPAPVVQDPTAARLAAATFGLMSADQIAEWLPTWG